MNCIIMSKLVGSGKIVGKGKMVKVVSATSKSQRKQRRLVTKVSKLSKFMKGEFRYNAINSLAQNATLAGVYTCVNCMVQGDADFTRGGDRITIYSLAVNALMYSAPPLTTIQPIVGRMIVLLHRQNNGGTTVPVAGEVLAGAGSTGNNFLASINPTFKHKYKILADKQVTLTPIANTRQAVGATTYDSTLRFLKVRKVWKKGLMVSYNAGNAGTAADIDKNAIYVIFICNGADNDAVYSVHARIRYTP